MANWGDRTTYQGKPVNQGTAQIFKAANQMVRTSYFGGEKSDITMVQGSYNAGGVAASAGTHDGGGAFDITPYNSQNRVKVFRLLGVAIWDRPTRPGLWSHHIHGIVCGDGTASNGAKNQVLEYYAGQDGLAGSGTDKGWRPKELPILFVFNANTDMRYARKTARLYDQPNLQGSPLNSVTVGEKVKPVAVVNVNGERWFITADGRCGREADFSTQPPDFGPAPLKGDWTIVRDTWGLTDYGGARKVARKKGYHLTTTQWAMRSGKTFYITRFNTWYSAEDVTPYVKS